MITDYMAYKLWSFERLVLSSFNKVYANAASVVDKTWEWPPIQEYVATQGDDIKSKSVDQGKGATAALQPWQDAVVNYAKQQGLKVQGQ